MKNRDYTKLQWFVLVLGAAVALVAGFTVLSGLFLVAATITDLNYNMDRIYDEFTNSSKNTTGDS